MNYPPSRILMRTFIKKVVLNLLFFVKKSRSQAMRFVQVRFSRPKRAKMINPMTFSERVRLYL